MFHHMYLPAKDVHRHKGNEFELVVYKSAEDSHLRGYISTGGFSDRIGHMPGEIAEYMHLSSGEDPAKMLIELMKSEINAGKFDSIDTYKPFNLIARENVKKGQDTVFVVRL